MFSGHFKNVASRWVSENIIDLYHRSTQLSLPNVCLTETMANMAYIVIAWIYLDKGTDGSHYSVNRLS